MKKADPHVVGKVFGVFFALVHAVWSLAVSMEFAQSYLDFVLGLHFLNNPYILQPFNLTTAVILVIVTFVVGYVLGYIGASIWNWKVKK